MGDQDGPEPRIRRLLSAIDRYQSAHAELKLAFGDLLERHKGELRITSIWRAKQGGSQNALQDGDEIFQEASIRCLRILERQGFEDRGPTSFKNLMAAIIALVGLEARNRRGRTVRLRREAEGDPTTFTGGRNEHQLQPDERFAQMRSEILDYLETRIGQSDARRRYYDVLQEVWNGNADNLLAAARQLGVGKPRSVAAGAGRWAREELQQWGPRYTNLPAG